MKSTAVVLTLLLCLLAACSGTRASAASAAGGDASGCAGRTAASAVREYYRALDQHRSHAAMACLARSYLTRVTSPTELFLPWTDVISAHVVTVAVRPIGASLLPEYVRRTPYRSAQVVAEVRVHYRYRGGVPSGLNAFFIYVIKQQRRSPWRIVEIGAGP